MPWRNMGDASSLRRCGTAAGQVLDREPRELLKKGLLRVNPNLRPPLTLLGDLLRRARRTPRPKCLGEDRGMRATLPWK